MQGAAPIRGRHCIAAWHALYSCLARAAHPEHSYEIHNPQQASHSPSLRGQDQRACQGRVASRFILADLVLDPGQIQCYQRCCNNIHAHLHNATC